MPLANWTIHKLIEIKMILDDKTREEIFWQLLEGIEFLHSIDVMHRDIKPLNMTVVSINPAHPEARLIDFGMATRGMQSCEYHVGTQQYQAPEMLAGWDNRTNDPYDERVDMFAFGLSMYQFFCLQPCGWGRIDMDREKNINTSNLTEIESRLFASRNRKELMELICSLISWDPQDRPSARETIRLGGRDQSAKNRDAEEKARIDRERDEIQDSGIGSLMGRLSISGAGQTSHDRSLRDQDQSARNRDEDKGAGNYIEQDEIQEGGMGSPMGRLSIHGPGLTSRDRPSRQGSHLSHDRSSRQESHLGGSRMFENKPHKSLPPRDPRGWNDPGHE